jgi:DNA-binding NarL/FixJ family response regulator
MSDDTGTEKRLAFASVSPENPLTVVIVDDHELFSAGLEFILNAASSGYVKVVGTTAEAGKAVELVRRCLPQVAIIDLSMPPPGGVEAIAAVKHAYPKVRVLALSGTDDVDFAIDALEAGANGFMLKSATPETLVPPLLALGLGISVMPEQLKQALLANGARPSRQLLKDLTDQERDLWRLLAQGLDTTELGERLFSSERTIKRLVASLLRKIGASNRHEAAALAGRCGLLDDLPAEPAES